MGHDNGAKRMRTLRRRAMMTGYRKLEYIAGKKIVGNNTPLGIKTSPDMSIVMKCARQNTGWSVLLNTNTEYGKLFNIGKSPDGYIYHNKGTNAYQISTTEEPIVVRVKSLSEEKLPVRLKLNVIDGPQLERTVILVNAPIGISISLS